MSEHNPNIHSKSKLGAIGVSPVLPCMPTAAQARAGMGITIVHYKILGDAYVSGTLPSWDPGRKEVVDALNALPRTDPSYSGSGSLYQALTVEPAADGQTFTLKAGDVVIGFGYVTDKAVMVSTDGDGHAATKH